MGLTLYKCFPDKPYNETLRRFHSMYWRVDFPSTTCATIRPHGNGRHLDVSADYRTNTDFVGVSWFSADKAHPLFAYQSDMDYSGCILSFQCNPTEPYDFSATIGGTVYRLFPYKIHDNRLVPVSRVDPTGIDDPGPGMSYPIDILCPLNEREPYDGYWYVVDFDNLRTGYLFDGYVINPVNIDKIMINLVDYDTYGLGIDAKLRDDGSRDEVTEFRKLCIENVRPQYKLTPGDIITTTITYTTAVVSGKSVEYDTETTTLTLPVDDWSGFGTEERWINLKTPLKLLDFVGGRATAVLQAASPLEDDYVHHDFALRNIHCVGPRAYVGLRNYPQPEHSLQMTSGFDDVYDITPERHVETIYKLGYRRHVVLYIGMSHYFQTRALWRNTRTGAIGVLPNGEPYEMVLYNKVVKNTQLNAPTRVWVENFLDLLAEKGYVLVWSQSYEILASAMPDEWKQRDLFGEEGLSGWNPPSAFLEPTNVEALQYWVGVALDGLSIVRSKGMPPMLQIGEPWWWDGSFSNGRPCIYGPTAVSRYTAETGLPVPEPRIENYMEPVTDYQRPYLEWLGGKLGESTIFIRDSVKAIIPETKVALLLFTPQIIYTTSEMMTVINFPVEYYRYPQFDFIQIEDYDWLIRGELELNELTINFPTAVLGYPLDKIHYFTGFVLLPKDEYIWSYVQIAIFRGFDAGFDSVYVWAYPQVVRDGVMFSDGVFAPPPRDPLQPERPVPDNIDLSQDVRLILLFELHVPYSDVVYLCSGARNVRIGDTEWTATGTIGRVGSVVGSLKNTSHPLNLGLWGLPEEASSIFVGTPLIGAEAKLHALFVDTTWTPLCSPIMLNSGIVGAVNITEDAGLASIQIGVYNKMIRWNYAVCDRFTDESQQCRYPEDRGLEYTPGISDLSLPWGWAK